MNDKKQTEKELIESIEKKETLILETIKLIEPEIKDMNMHLIEMEKYVSVSFEKEFFIKYGQMYKNILIKMYEMKKYNKNNGGLE